MQIRNFGRDLFQLCFLWLLSFWLIEAYKPYKPYRPYKPFKYTKTIDPCEYYQLLGIYKPECEPEKEVVMMNEVEDYPVALSYPDHPLCQGMFHTCMASETCESGSICTLSMSNKPCCTKPGSRCPSVTELGFSCTRINPTNWCFTDDDCSYSRTERQICCPTGCNYNVCVHEQRSQMPKQRYYNLITSQRLLSEDCPVPYEIPVQCVKVNPTSWCMSQSDCPSVNSLYPRRCCMTQCGYNACVVKIGGTWLIA